MDFKANLKTGTRVILTVTREDLRAFLTEAFEKPIHFCGDMARAEETFPVDRYDRSSQYQITCAEILTLVQSKGFVEFWQVPLLLNHFARLRQVVPGEYQIRWGFPA